MNTYLIFGTSIVLLALASYSIGVITEQLKKILSKTVIVFITLGVVLDITATIFMIIGSSKTGLTIHGMIGYSSLLLMLIDAILLWRFKSKTEMNALIPRGLHLYTRFAYLWWVAAFITGLLLVILK